MGTVRVSDGSFGVDADTVGDALAEVGPNAAVRYAPVGGNVEGCELLA